jgi:hypothetical protein
VLHTKPHALPSHVEVAFAGGSHGVHAAPQVATSVSATHALPQAWKPVAHESTQTPATQAVDPFVIVPHVRPHAPQFVASVVTSRHATPQSSCPGAHAAQSNCPRDMS